MQTLRELLIEKARLNIREDDPAHDIDHALRVLSNAEYLVRFEGGDLEVIIPAALFHDVVTYSKDDPRSKSAAEESAVVVRKIMQGISCYPQEKVRRVETAIREHAYSAGIRPESLDSKIVQDADRLEATGAIAIMRTFCSTGQMKRKFYNPEDPFCEKRMPDNYALDLFYKRLLKVTDVMNTKTAKKLAEKRTRFLYTFLEQVREEIVV